MRIVVPILVLSALATGARIKDISTIRGARDNQLVGYGVVAGLGGTGDKSGIEEKGGAVHQLLKGLGVDLKDRALDTRNAAEVMVQAWMPPFATAGTRIDVTVSSIGNATSLEGGTLLMTPLKGADGSVYAVSQGKISIYRRKDARGALQSQIVSSGTISAGAVLEKVVPVEISRNLTFNLLQADFTTAARMAIRINEELGGKYATAVDAGRVDIIAPYDYEGSGVELIALLESIDVEADRRARVVINERSGTVVMGERVTVAPVAISHGNLRLEVTNPVAQVAPREKSVGLLIKGTSVADVATGLNDLGASPDDLVAILAALRASGSLMADVEIK